MKPSHGGLCLVLVALLAACENTDSSKPNGDWVARVNAGGVTNKQIDFELAQNPKLRQSDPDSVGKLVVRQLAQQELLAQKAVETQLEKDPTVTIALESARRQVLAQAYLEKLAAATAVPTAQEAETLHKDYPELFEGRQIFQFDELIVAGKGLDIKSIEQQAAAKTPLLEIAKGLQAAGAQVQGGRITKSSEQMPLDRVKVIHQLQIGDILVTSTGKDRVSVAQLVAKQAQPISADKIAVASQQYLLAGRRKTLLQEEVKKLVATAKIEYLGAFAELNAHVADPVEFNSTEKSPNSLAPTGP